MAHTDTHGAFVRRQGVLCCEGLSLADFVERLDGPAYVYSRARMEANAQRWIQALGGNARAVHYAVKANPTRGVLKLMANLGLGFDTVSIGEIERAIAAGARADSIVFSGVGKSEAELERALALDIACFNVESKSEFERLTRVALRTGKRARFALRCNPDVNAQTHPYISTGLRNNKFGVAMAEVPDLYRRAHAEGVLEPVGLDCHIGSQITTAAPYYEAVEKLLDMAELLRSEGIVLKHLDIGGGLGIAYTAADHPPAPAELVGEVRKRMAARGLEALELWVEPGRSIVGDAGALLTRIEYLKAGVTKNFCIVDAGMNDLVRPALYDAWMDILPVAERSDAPTLYDVVGPVCESGDFLGKERQLAVREGDWLAVTDAGAYGSSMASSYNSRPLPAEYLVDGERVVVLRTRQTPAEMTAGECDPAL